MHIHVDATGAGHRRPAWPQATPALDQLSFQNENEFGQLVLMRGEVRAGFEAQRKWIQLTQSAALLESFRRHEEIETLDLGPLR